MLLGFAPLQFGHLEGILHHFEDGEAASAGDVRAQCDRNTGREETTYRRDAGTEVTVGCRAVNCKDMILAHEFKLLAIRIAAMCHECRRLAEHAVAQVCVAIAG